MQIHWDPTVSLGTILTIVTIISSLYSVARYINRIEAKVDEMYSWFQLNTERRLVSRIESNEKHRTSTSN